MIISTKICAIIFISALALLILWAVVGGILESNNIIKGAQTKKTIANFSKLFSLAMVFIMAFFAMPVLVTFVIKGFIFLQIKMGHQDYGVVKFLVANQQRVISVLVYSFWTIFVFGAAIAGFVSKFGM